MGQHVGFVTVQTRRRAVSPRKLNVHSSAARGRKIVSARANFAIASRGKMGHLNRTARGFRPIVTLHSLRPAPRRRNRFWYFRPSHAHA
jgi:hypothetical protein